MPGGGYRAWLIMALDGTALATVTAPKDEDGFCKHCGRGVGEEVPVEVVAPGDLAGEELFVTRGEGGGWIVAPSDLRRLGFVPG